MKMAKRIACLIVILFFTVAMTPPAAFCDDKQDTRKAGAIPLSRGEATIGPVPGAGAAGGLLGTGVFAGVSNGTIVVSAIVLGAIITGVAVAIGGSRGGSDTGVPFVPVSHH
jgi:hypothetical protein